MELFLLCFKLFSFRIIDVSMGTVRTILIVRGKSVWASVCGFFEILIWFLVVREALTSEMSGIAIAVAYAAGFAAGTYIGGKVSNRFIKSNLEVQIVTSFQNDELVKAIRDKGFAVSVVNVNPSEYSNEKHMIFAEIKSRRLDELREVVYALDSRAFITVHETRLVYNGYFKKK